MDNKVLDWVTDNYQWLFSGAAVAVLGAGLAWWRSRPREKESEHLRQRSGSRSVNIQVKGVANQLLISAEKLQGQQQQSDRLRCEALGNYLKTIADSLQETAEGLEQGRRRDLQLSELATYRELLPDAIRNDLTLMDLDRLMQTLQEALDQPLGLVVGSAGFQAHELKKAAGVFRALGESCRVHF